jgi:class 3 adenylate cyclase/tetratricopeptide (TPR) repeat protein
MAEARKTVTVVFSDVAGSTSLGERLDPEAVRRVMERYFDEARTALEHHGGTVEKFIGDAVMAAFGIPQVHEDDALRAVRAAIDLQGRIANLNDELEREWGIRIAIRTGINTGEVVAADGTQGETFATGDAVNVAARLQQTAGPGQILIGELTHRLLGAAIRVEEVESLTLAGKAKPVQAWRLLEVLPDAPAFTRPLRTPFVGREDELAKLEGAFAHAAAERSCQLVTVIGLPGIGKSRLAHELVLTAGEQARVVVGRCVPYGEGITYWPLVEILQQVTGRDSAGLSGLLLGNEDAELIANRIAAAVGRVEPGGRSEEIAWAVGKLLEALARERPLIVVLDDLHWAEPTFLDLIEYLAGFASGPVLLLALARPDLLDERASWAMPRPNASTVLLEPLSETEAGMLIEQVGGGTGLSESALRRIAEASEGNPLFLEQMLAFRAEDSGHGDELVPPTIQALLATRIDRLNPGERAVIERASIEGRSFHRGAVSELLPEASRASVGSDLMSLVRKQLIRPGRAAFAGDDGFRFVHVLVQEAAYAGIAKELRADLHERFATWLERSARERLAEYEAILGYHLEHAYLYRAELSPVDEHGRALARLAAVRLGAAGRRAWDLGDILATVNLLERAIALSSEAEPTRAELLTLLAWATSVAGPPEKADALFAEAITAARSFELWDVAWYAQLERLSLQMETDPHCEPERVRHVAKEAIPVLEELGNDRCLARAWRLLAEVHHLSGQLRAAEENLDRALEHARRARDRTEETAGLNLLVDVVAFGPTPVVDAKRRVTEVLEDPEDLMLEARALRALGILLAMERRFEDARKLIGDAKAIYENLGLKGYVANTATHSSADVERRSGDMAAAERELRFARDVYEETAAETELPNVAARLGQILCDQGRYEEAESLAGIAETDAAGSDYFLQPLWRRVKARALAQRGALGSAEALAREAVRLSRESDDLDNLGDALVDLAEVMRLAGRPEEAASATEEALRLHEQKGNIVSVEKARFLLAELGT